MKTIDTAVLTGTESEWAAGKGGNQSGADENRPDAGYPRGDHRIVRAPACGIREERVREDWRASILYYNTVR